MIPIQRDRGRGCKRWVVSSPRIPLPCHANQSVNPPEQKHWAPSRSQKGGGCTQWAAPCVPLHHAMQIKVITHLSSDIGVAVPVSPHPGAEEKRGAPNGQLPVRVLLQGRVQLAHIGWNGGPQRLLHNVQPTARLCTASINELGIGSLCTSTNSGQAPAYLALVAFVLIILGTQRLPMPS